jgi:hypothetical protein
VPSVCERSPEPEFVNEPELTSRFLITSQMIAAPWASILLLSTIWTGDGASSAEPRIKDPVTSTSSISLFVSCATAPVANEPMKTARASALRLLGQLLSM